MSLIRFRGGEICDSIMEYGLNVQVLSLNLVLSFAAANLANSACVKGLFFFLLLQFFYASSFLVAPMDSPVVAESRALLCLIFVRNGSVPLAKSGSCDVHCVSNYFK